MSGSIFGDAVASHVEVVKCFIQKAGFSGEVTKVVTMDLRVSTAGLY